MSELQSFIRTPRAVPAETSLAQAARRMQQWHVGALVVLQGEEAVGMVTDRDLALHAMSEGASTDAVSSCMSSPPRTIGEQDSVHDAVEAMRRNGVRRLVVLNSEGLMVGVVAADDFFSESGSQMGHLAGAIQREFHTEEHPMTPSPSVFGKE